MNFICFFCCYCCGLCRCATSSALLAARASLVVRCKNKWRSAVHIRRRFKTMDTTEASTYMSSKAHDLAASRGHGCSAAMRSQQQAISCDEREQQGPKDERSEKNRSKMLLATRLLTFNEGASCVSSATVLVLATSYVHVRLFILSLRCTSNTAMPNVGLTVPSFAKLSVDTTNWKLFKVIDCHCHYLMREARCRRNCGNSLEAGSKQRFVGIHSPGRHGR